MIIASQLATLPEHQFAKKMSQGTMQIAAPRPGAESHDRFHTRHPLATDSNLTQARRWIRKLALLPSELTTVACVAWVASRLYSPGSVTGRFEAQVVALWLLVVLAAQCPLPACGPLVLLRCFGLGGIILLAHASCPGLGWDAAIAVGGMLGVVLAVTWTLLRWASGGGGFLTWADGWRGAALQIVAAYALQAYVVSAQVGSGTPTIYSLMLADAVGQLRAGVFPLFVGQTPYAFNGNIHTLRTAPLFEYLGGGLDFLTLHTLPTFGLLQGLVLLLAAGLGALGCYAALRRYVPDRPWEAAGLAALYILCPGILAPLYGGDMIATFLTVPIIPWLVVCLAKASDDPRRWTPWLGQAAALAALWWAHPPVAFWSTLLALGAAVLVILRGGWQWRILVQMACASLLFALLAAYVFVSVHTLQLRPAGATEAELVANVMQSDSEGWRSSLLPLTDKSYLGGIQLGYSLMAGALTGLLALKSRRSSATLLAGIAVFLILLFPIPGVTARLWTWAPPAVLSVTNSWPAQRFYVILAGLSAFAAVAGLSRLGRGRGAGVLAGLGFAAALCWSAAEVHTLILHGRTVSSTRERSERSHRLENVMLTRSSYLMFNFFPPYFSHGVMTPFLETRLIDPKTFDVLADGSTPVSGQVGRTEETVELKGPDGTNKLSPLIHLASGHTSLLHFDFMGQEPEGVLEMTSPTLLRDYELPSSGMGKSFGAGPANGRVIAIANDGAKPEDVRFLFFPKHSGGRSGDPFAKVTVEWLDSAARVIGIRSLLPFEAVVQSQQPAFLETPKVFVPGYSATLNGHPTMAVKSGNGLVAVPVPAGLSLVRVDYPGVPLLRLAFWVSAIGWVGLAAAFSIAPVLDSRQPPAKRADESGRPTPGRIRLWGAPLLAIIALAAAGLWFARRLDRGKAGPVHLVLVLPWSKAGSAEPLVTTGRTGAGDIIYLKYLGAGQIAVGHDKWSYGGSVSDPIDVDSTQPQTVDIAMGSLGYGHGVRVWWNGRPILSDTQDTYAPDPAAKVEIGANRIGGSTCQPLFTGRILESSRGNAVPPEASAAAPTS